MTRPFDRSDGPGAQDEGLGRALRALYVPAHGPEFHVQLARRLDEEAAAARPGQRRKGWRRPPMFLGLAAAVLLVVVAVSTMFTGDGPSPLRPLPPDTQLISATEVRTRVSTALSSLQSLRGEVTIECAIRLGGCLPPDAGGRTTLRWSFVTTAAGDERISGIGRQDDVAYSAARREQRVLSDGRPAAQVISNLPPGPPDQAARPSVLRRDVAAVVRAFLSVTVATNVAGVKLSRRRSRRTSECQRSLAWAFTL